MTVTTEGFSDHARIRARMEAVPEYGNAVREWLAFLEKRIQAGHEPRRGHTAVGSVGYCPPCDAASLLSPDVVRSRR